MQIFDDIEVQISEEKMIRLQGSWHKDKRLSPNIESLFHRGIEEGHQLMQPRASYDELLAELVKAQLDENQDGGLW